MLDLPKLTPEQRELVQSAALVLEADSQIAAAWLAGSLGRGSGDAYSDVDLLVLVTGVSALEAGRRYVREVVSIAPPALVNALYGGLVINVVTEDWRRFDLSFVAEADLARYDAAHLVELFNRTAHTPPIKPPETYVTSPEVVIGLVKEFLRVLGLSVVAVGRKEWLLAQWGSELLRRLTMDLMLEENGVSPPDRGGTLRRRPLLTAEQLASLEALTPATPDLDGVLTSHREIAALFLPRARALAERIGAEWPSKFEEATRRHLSSNLGLEID